MTMTNFGEAQVMNHRFRTATYTKPASVWFATFTADPTEAGTLTSELALARIQVTVANASWDLNVVAGVTTLTNLAVIEFEEATSALGTAAFGGICDAATAGNLLHYGALNPTREVGAGVILRFPIGSIVLTLD